MKKYDHIIFGEVLVTNAGEKIHISNHRTLEWQLAVVRHNHLVINSLKDPHPIAVFLSDALASKEPDLFERFMDSPTDELMREVIIHRGHYRLVDYPELIQNIPTEIVLQAKMSM